MHGPTLAHPWLSEDPSGRILPAFIFTWPVFGDRSQWQPFHWKASACPFAHPHWEATSTVESFLFALMMKRLITHCSAFQIAEAGSGGKNTIKAIVSKHGLSRTMMNGLEEACAYSHSIIRCWLVDFCQEGRRHSLLESGLLFLFLAEVWLNSCHCHSILVSFSRKQSKAAQRTNKKPWDEKAGLQWTQSTVSDQLSPNTSAFPEVVAVWAWSWLYSYNRGRIWRSGQKPTSLAWNVWSVTS